MAGALMAGPIRYDAVMGKTVEITGQRFGRLTVLRRDGSDNINRSMWLCRCDCGTELRVRWVGLRSGDNVSCGCYNRENAVALGKSKHKGDDVAYQTAHDRLRRHRGPAKTHTCVDCGKTAAQWSLRHDARKRTTGRTQHCEEMAWSPDVDDYEPRCIPCHKVYDGTEG